MVDSETNKLMVREYEAEVSDSDWNELVAALSGSANDEERRQVFCQWLHDKAAQARAEIEAAQEVGNTYSH